MKSSRDWSKESQNSKNKKKREKEEGEKETRRVNLRRKKEKSQVIGSPKIS